MGTLLWKHFKGKGSIESKAMTTFTQKFFICICFLLLINQPPVSEAGQPSIDACNNKAEGDVCIKPACEGDNPKPWCACEGPEDPHRFYKGKEECTCKPVDGKLHCKRPIFE